MSAAAARPVVAPAAWSIALHLALAGLLFVSLSARDPDDALEILPIDAVVVDQAVIDAASRQRREIDRIAAEERRKVEAEARARREEAERLEQAQAEQRAAEQRRLEAEQAAQARARAEAEARRRAEQQAQAKAAADRKRAADEARQRAERESELRARLADEEQRTSAGFQSLKAQYVRAIQAHVEQRWFEPPGIGQGASCTVHVTQIPGGEVTGMRFGACNGGEAMRRSIETAVRNASPLPAPPEPALFEREVRLVFTPKESAR
ncbi:MAG: cell envelope integrity protein TolA [Steroidobacteraceae bacterium]|nr:cell envelope integrity protein TolA [Steroidobacteraceae bacterium]